jgi:hypothetical protein
VAALETLLEHARAYAHENQRWHEIMSNAQERQIATQERQISAQERENKRLQEENDALRQELLLVNVAAKTTLFLQDTELEDSLSCPISKALFTDPVVSMKTGHSYNREHIEQWLLENPSCPLTRTTMTSADLVPNYTLAAVVEAFKSQQLA